MKEPEKALFFASSKCHTSGFLIGLPTTCICRQTGRLDRMDMVCRTDCFRQVTTTDFFRLLRVCMYYSASMTMTTSGLEYEG